MARVCTRGHVLLEVRSSHAEEDEDDEEVVPEASHNPYELGLVWLLAQAVSRLLFAPQIAAAVAASSSCSLAAARHDPVTSAAGGLGGLRVGVAGGVIRPALWRRDSDCARRRNTARRGGDVAPGRAGAAAVAAGAEPRADGVGELALLQWSPEDDDALIAARSVDVSEKNVLRDVPSSDELAAAGELREELGEQPARWLETGELLRFVRARKTLKERASLVPRSHGMAPGPPDWIEDDASFGGAERRWCDDPATAPAWHRWMGTVLPFELFGTCRSGVPITFVGLGRMDLTGIQRK